MKKYIDFDASGVLKARYDSAINKTIPETAVEVSDALFRQTIAETDGQWKRDSETGEIVKHPFPWPSIEQKIAAAEAKRDALLAATDWYAIRAAEPDGTPIPENVLTYRRALRELDQHPDWPDVTFPVLAE